MQESRSGDERRSQGLAGPLPDPCGIASAPGGREPPAAAAAVADGLLQCIERSTVAIAIADRESLEIRYANPAFERLSERPDGSAHGLRLTSALPPHAGDAVSALVASLSLDDHAHCEAEIRSGRGDASMADWNVSISRVPRRAGRAGDLVVEIRDISHEYREQRAQARLLDQLREVNGRLLDSSLREAELAARAEAASEAKSAFLATMSHELRTPLTAILGYEELLADGIFGPVTELQRVHLGRMKLSAVHLLALIDQVLQLARVDAGSEVVELGTVTVGELVEWTTLIVEPLAIAKGIRFVKNVSDAQVTLRTDTLKVRQILVNLLGNAVKFTDAGEVSLSTQDGGDMMTFTIRDTGIGISPGDQERIFGSFWQVEQRPTRKVGGSGLGLAVSRRLARLLSGDITVESTPGAGSTFVVTLPVEARRTAG